MRLKMFSYFANKFTQIARMSHPPLSIIMPMYNAERFVKEAVDSLLIQSWRDFELIVINDGSTDSSAAIIKSYNDPRIRLIENDGNRGIVYSRNRGLQAARGEFIAAFDADDVAMPRKFELQLNYLYKHPGIGMIGSWARRIDENGKRCGRRWKLSAPPERITAILLFRNYFVHSAVVMRREVIPESGYAHQYDSVEDYRMWFDIASGYQVWNYPEYLVNYRMHRASATGTGEMASPEQEKRLYSYLFSKAGIPLDDARLDAHLMIKGQKPIHDIRALKQIENHLLQILDHNRQNHFLNQAQLAKVVFGRWLKACRLAGHFFPGMPVGFLRSALLRNYLSAYAK